MNICIYEDDQYNNFYPLSLSRPAYDLKCGIFTLREKIIRYFPNTNVHYICRQHLTVSVQKNDGKILKSTKNLKECLFINGRILANEKLVKLSLLKKDTLIYSGKQIIGAFLTGDNLIKLNLDDSFTFKIKGLKKLNLNIKLIDYIWEIVHLNVQEIAKDAKHFKLGKNEGTIYPNTSLINKQAIFIGPGVTIKPGVVLDAKNGPIIIDKNTEIMPNAVITGPVYIGKNCLIKIGAKIYPGTSIGQVCKVGGEVEGSIIHGYSNKQHEGFLGHAYIGTWCNLGADTNNSDLKNNYGSVDVILDGKKIQSGETFVGLFMGDHSKSGINTMFNTGTTVGFSCNVFGAGYLPKYIPSFSWIDASSQPVKYKLDKAIEVANKVMKRRNLKFSKIDEKLFIQIYNESIENDKK